jgi:UDP-3-O-[3-hydroxymyristoyl] glucosamine N-acyltransferase
MLIHDSTKLCIAISYTTNTLLDLQTFLKQEHNISLGSITPEEFLDQSSADEQYINLVVQDFDLREKVSKKLDHLQAKRFSFIHPTTFYGAESVAGGIFIYPNCTIYPSTFLDKDIIVHSLTAIAHNATVGQGTVISGATVIAGSSQIGTFCFFGLRSTVIDNLCICDHVRVAVGALLTKNISIPGMYVGAPARKVA